jgi:hypothetical protein
VNQGANHSTDKCETKKTKDPTVFSINRQRVQESNALTASRPSSQQTGLLAHRASQESLKAFRSKKKAKQVAELPLSLNPQQSVGKPDVPLQVKKPSLNDFRYDEKPLGCGHFGKVLLAVYKPTDERTLRAKALKVGKLFALKMVPLHKLTDDTIVQHLINERDIL